MWTSAARMRSSRCWASWRQSLRMLKMPVSTIPMRADPRARATSAAPVKQVRCGKAVSAQVAACQQGVMLTKRRPWPRRKSISPAEHDA